MIKTEQELRARIKELNISSIIIRRCSICKHPLFFRIIQDEVFLDTNCDCVSWTSPLTPKTWKELTDYFNANQVENNPKINPDWISELNKHFGFEQKPKTATCIPTDEEITKAIKER